MLSALDCECTLGRLVRDRVNLGGRTYVSRSGRIGLRRHDDYYVEDCQQYLAKHVNGYRCHANTGVKFPETA